MVTILPKKVFYPSYEDVKPSKSKVSIGTLKPNKFDYSLLFSSIRVIKRLMMNWSILSQPKLNENSG